MKKDTTMAAEAPRMKSYRINFKNGRTGVFQFPHTYALLYDSQHHDQVRVWDRNDLVCIFQNVKSYLHFVPNKHQAPVEVPEPKPEPLPDAQQGDEYESAALATALPDAT